MRRAWTLLLLAAVVALSLLATATAAHAALQSTLKLWSKSVSGHYGEWYPVKNGLGGDHKRCVWQREGGILWMVCPNGHVKKVYQG